MTSDENIPAGIPADLIEFYEGEHESVTASEMSECCSSGSCEVCRAPRGYSRERRERIAREFRDYEPPWMRERNRDR